MLIGLVRRTPLLLVGLFVAHLALVMRYAVNVPFWDEWDNLEAWEPSLSFRWLIGTQNEHRFIPTRFEMWTFGRLFGGDVRLELIFNFLLFGVVLWLLFRLLRRLAPSMERWSLAGFFLFLLSFLFWENHINGINSVFHFILLFFLSAIGCLFLRGQAFLGGILLCAGAYSQASGVAPALTTWTIFAAFSVKRGRWRDALVAGLPLAVFIPLWFVGHPMVGGHLPRPPVLSFAVAAGFLNAVSLGFGILTVSWPLGLLCLLLVVVPLVRLWSVRRNHDAEAWALTALVVGVFAILGTIAVGRSHDAGGTKAPRYAEHAALLVPLAAVLWHLAIDSLVWRRRVLVGLWALVAVAYVEHWNPRKYVQTHAVRMAGLNCLRAQLGAGPATYCPELYPRQLDKRWDAVERLKPRFYRELTKPDGAD